MGVSCNYTEIPPTPFSRSSNIHEEQDGSKVLELVSWNRNKMQIHTLESRWGQAKQCHQPE